MEDSGDNESSGVFTKLFKCILLKDKVLVNVFANVSKDVSYTLAMTQDETVKILKETVLEKETFDINSSDGNGLTSKVISNGKNVSVAIRFVKQGKVRQSLIGLPSLYNFDTDIISSVMLVCISICGVCLKKILSQCCDGASVVAER